MGKEYELVGGQPVKISPLEATEAGTYYAPLGQAFNPVTVSGGSSLPEVTSDDNGDVLTVVEGEWAKAAPSGGGGIYWVTLTYDGATDTYTANKSYNDILTALDNGQMVLGVLTETNEDGTSNNYYNLTDFGKLNDNSLFFAVFAYYSERAELQADSASSNHHSSGGSPE